MGMLEKAEVHIDNKVFTESDINIIIDLFKDSYKKRPDNRYYQYLNIELKSDDGSSYEADEKTIPDAKAVLSTKKIVQLI